jgi:hypothetical protein
MTAIPPSDGSKRPVKQQKIFHTGLSKSMLKAINRSTAEAFELTSKARQLKLNSKGHYFNSAKNDKADQTFERLKKQYISKLKGRAS